MDIQYLVTRETLLGMTSSPYGGHDYSELHVNQIKSIWYKVVPPKEIVSPDYYVYLLQICNRYARIY